MRGALKLAIAGATAMVVARGEPTPMVGEPLLVDDPDTLIRLEAAGYSFTDFVAREHRAVINETVTADMAELAPIDPATSPRRAFQPTWLTRGHFELVGVVNRLDRRVFDQAGCGEVRLVYRLALKNRGRPVTRLPMTVNVRIPQPKAPGDGHCARVAERWSRRDDLVGLLRELPRYSKIETNLQSIHVPSIQRDMDDHAEYVLRAFAVDGAALRPDGLFNTPRTDLNDDERGRLRAWIEGHLDAIDEASAVVPEEFLAKRAISVSPRGLVHIENRPFSTILGAARTAFEGISLARAKRTTTPELVMRRLDEATCVGCHQSRAIAGFHLLGEERDPATTFNALAVGHSAHLAADLEWRIRDLDAVTKGARPPLRPFADYPDGRAGSVCGLAPDLDDWRCAPGLVCRDVHSAEWGTCAPKESKPGDPCEDVARVPSKRELGEIVTARGHDATCPPPVGQMRTGAFCAPNYLGFTGGMCTERCSNVGELRDGKLCARLPSAGYEGDCFFEREPIEECMERHLVTQWIAACGADMPCRDDYGCARMPGAPAGVGGCVPPYFVFQARLDGPLLDR